jgi:hypothetical protein
MACDDTCFYAHVQQHEEGASQRSVSAEVWTVKVVEYVCCMCVVCVSATVHTPVRRGGCTGSDPGLTWGMATLIRVCERGMRSTSRA